MSALRHDVIRVQCPTCGGKGRGPDVLSDWDGSTYLFRCGHRHHLNEERGGAKTWTETSGRHASPASSSDAARPVSGEPLVLLHGLKEPSGSAASDTLQEDDGS